MKLRNKKTGEVVEAIERGMIDIYFYSNEHEVGYDFDRKTYNSLAELNADWEDYKPKEPLIKDEKVRKAVRAWADACCIELIEITHSRKSILRAMDAITDNDEICINREIGQIVDEKVYNIDELCGEEEE